MSEEEAKSSELFIAEKSDPCLVQGPTLPFCQDVGFFLSG